jgi:hypothetical protein
MDPTQGFMTQHGIVLVQRFYSFLNEDLDNLNYIYVVLVSNHGIIVLRVIAVAGYSNLPPYTLNTPLEPLPTLPTSASSTQASGSPTPSITREIYASYRLRAGPRGVQGGYTLTEIGKGPQTQWRARTKSPARELIKVP